MRKCIGIFILIGMLSCSNYVDKPKNLLSQDDMAGILADLAINDQATFMYQNKNLEAGTRYVLKVHNVKADDFVASFKYYTVTQKINSIADQAQKIVLEKDPKADKYVKDKLKNNGNVPAFAR